MNGRKACSCSTTSYKHNTRTESIKYCATCNEAYGNGGKTCGHETLATREMLQRYKDAGFNYLYIDWVFNNQAQIIEVMDIAHELGLKCIVHEPYVYGLTYERHASLIDPSKADGRTYFASQEALDAYVAEKLKDVQAHPAFDGVVFDDEPKYDQFQAMSEVYAAVKKAAPNAKVMVNLLPYAESDAHEMLYCGTTDHTVQEAYRLYLEEYYELLGKDLGYVSYDDYPILNGRNGTNTNTYVLPSYLYGNQVVSDFCEEKGLQRETLYQTCTYSNRDQVTEADIYFQMNIGMAFGNKSYAYYTYYPTLNLGGKYVPEDESAAQTHEDAYIVDRAGNPNDIYDWVKAATEEMQFNAKALMHFDYCGMQYEKVGTLPSSDYTSGLVDNEFALLEGYSFTIADQNGGIVLVTELYDEAKDQYGYYVVNITDPQFTSTATVTLDFGAYTNAQIYQSSQISNVATDGGKVVVTLGAGRGAFVMPYSPDTL